MSFWSERVQPLFYSEGSVEWAIPWTARRRTAELFGASEAAGDLKRYDQPMKITWILAIALAPALTLAQEGTPTVTLTAAEKQFQESLTNVTLKGFFTIGDEPATHEDAYLIERVTKVKDDLWNFEARISYEKREFKATVQVPVKWAGDTPVLTLSNYLIKGQGVYSARILIFNGMYAGTWGAQDHGGKMFGKIVKNEAPK
jgi:hypothetical protein